MSLFEKERFTLITLLERETRVNRSRSLFKENDFEQTSKEQRVNSQPCRKQRHIASLLRLFEINQCCGAAKLDVRGLIHQHRTLSSSGEMLYTNTVLRNPVAVTPHTIPQFCPPDSLDYRSELILYVLPASELINIS